MSWLFRLLASIDRFTVGLAVAIAASVLWPCKGFGAVFFDHASNAAITLLFFLYGAKLSRQAVIEGLLHWKLQGVVAASTFLLFPLLGLLLHYLFGDVLGDQLFAGMLYVCMLPSTVQSSIAFTSIARGNVAAAICAASLSSLLGVFLTPFLVGVFIASSTSGAGLDWSVFGNICLIILVPFILGQCMQRFIGNWVRKHKDMTSWTDQSTVWLVVYTAFSHSMTEGIWHNASWSSLGWVVLACGMLLFLALIGTSLAGKIFRFSREDRIALIFCGSKKSLATGVPMMNVIFAGSPIGLMVIPLMIFHQIQLVVCAVLARRWSRDIA